MSPKDFIVEVAHESNCLFYGFAKDIRLAVDSAHIFHEADEGVPDGFLQTFTVEPEEILEL